MVIGGFSRPIRKASKLRDEVGFKMEYLTTYQTSYGWYTLNQPVQSHLKKNEGWWCFSSKNGDNYYDAEYWESVYMVNSKCARRENPKHVTIGGGVSTLTVSRHIPRMSNLLTLTPKS